MAGSIRCSHLETGLPGCSGNLKRGNFGAVDKPCRAMCVRRESGLGMGKEENEWNNYANLFASPVLLFSPPVLS